MKKNSLFLMLIAFVFLFSAANVSAKSLDFASSISETSVFENTLEANNPQRRYWLKITNNSRYDIYHLYVSSAESARWGQDQFGSDFYLQAKGGTFTLTDIVPGDYDIKFVDEDGDECVLEDISIFANKNWALTTTWLTNCEGY